MSSLLDDLSPSDPPEEGGVNDLLNPEQITEVILALLTLDTPISVADAIAQIQNVKNYVEELPLDFESLNHADILVQLEVVKTLNDVRKAGGEEELLITLTHKKRTSTIQRPGVDVEIALTYTVNDEEKSTGFFILSESH